MTEKAATNDAGKAPLAWLPWAAIEGMAMVQAFGHSKYKDFNNFRKGMEVSRNLSCALRHIKEYMEGIELDHESKRNPLEHAMCRIAFVLQNLHDGVAIDDRYKKPVKVDGSGPGGGDPLPASDITPRVVSRERLLACPCPSCASWRRNNPIDES